MTAQNGVNTALTRPGRVFPRPFTHGGDKALMGGTHEGEHRPYWGHLTLTDLTDHKLKVLLMLSCNYTMQLIGYDSIKTL